MFDKVISTMFRANPTETVEPPVKTPSAPENTKDKELCKECLEKVTLLSEENLRLTEENQKLTAEKEQLTAENQTLKTVEQRYADYRTKNVIGKTVRNNLQPMPDEEQKEELLLDAVRGHLEKSIQIRVNEDNSVEITDKDGNTITEPEASRQLQTKVKAYLLAIGVLKRSYGQENQPVIPLTPSVTFPMQGLPQARAHAERMKVS